MVIAVDQRLGCASAIDPLGWERTSDRIGAGAWRVHAVESRGIDSNQLAAIDRYARLSGDSRTDRAGTSGCPRVRRSASSGSSVDG